MQIEFERDGGFAGIPLRYYANTEELPVEIAEELLKLIAISVFFDLQTDPASIGPPDTFRYRLSLSENSRKKSLSFNEVAVPATLRPLLDYLQKLAQGLTIEAA